MNFILIIESDPQFAAINDFIIYTPKGEVMIEKGSPVGLLKTSEGYIHLGKSGDVLEMNNKTLISDILSNCQPARFELTRNEEGDSVVKAVLMEDTFLMEDKISMINLRENVPERTLKVEKIRLI